MPVRAMTAPGPVPITPWKHIQASQDAAAVSASAATASRKFARSGNVVRKECAMWLDWHAGRRAAVVSEWDGRRHVVVLRASESATLRSRATRFRLGSTSSFGALLPANKSRGGRFGWFVGCPFWSGFADIACSN
jgi:hypothetical protein